MPDTPVPSPNRRTVLLAGLGAVLAGCANPSTPATPPTTASGTGLSPTRSPALAGAPGELAALESTFGGRLGVYAVDTADGTEVRHRADERFLMCSTAKVPVSAAVLRRRLAEPGLLERVIRYTEADLLEYAPVTSEHVAEGMTVADLCVAALTRSDNTAVNLLLPLVGGPAGMTDLVRTLGDRTTRFDRPEPDLNVTAPGDERDTSTPAALSSTVRALVVGDGLDQPGRELLAGWMRASVTGKDLIRAGVPAGWDVADKSGSGAQGEVNNVAVVWPPNRAPWVVTVFTSPTDPKTTRGRTTVAAAAGIVARALG
ncbi:class A beta-lactamase [Actinokineospora sp. PR83]|uniref:class A beta-lactamase n=1 Tax=Actinokineospora sp. PR83 TaxID=2884908 RepID=UPI0027DFF851|nr:class A beta-lactamase [Actinokineospora sp. PR83]MCG8914624.1 class A beta-lactamase [Actinokineospora sp. PR83]